MTLFLTIFLFAAAFQSCKQETKEVKEFTVKSEAPEYF